MANNKMTLVTTPIMEFILPEHFSTEPTDYKITYQQNGKRVLEKEKGEEGVTFSDHTIFVNLTQDETKKFVPNVKAVCKVKLKTDAGRVMESQFLVIDIIDTLHRESL